MSGTRPLDDIRARLLDGFLHSVAIDAASSDHPRTAAAYRLFTNTLRAWVENTPLGDTLSPEDRAWARLTYSPDVLDEIDHKVDLGCLRPGSPVFVWSATATNSRRP